MSRKEKYIWQKPGARNLWFQMAVPTRFRAVAGCSIIQRDLGTIDRTVASIEAGRLRAKLFDDWQRRATRLDAAEEGAGGGPQPSAEGGVAPTKVVPTMDDLRIAATKSIHLSMVEDHEHFKRMHSLGLAVDEGDYELRAVMMENHLSVLMGGNADLIPTIARYLIAQNNWDIHEYSDLEDKFIEMVWEASLDTTRVELEKLRGNLGARPTSEVVLAGLDALRRSADKGEEIPTLFERYASQRLAGKMKRPDSINQDRKVVGQFSDFVGARRSLGSITPADVRSWRDTIAQVPPGYSKIKAYSGLDLKQVAAAAVAAGKPGLHPLTVNKNLSAVSAFFSWAVDDQYVTSNPCNGLFFNAKKAKKQRLPFTIEQLNAIFSSPLFTGFLGHGKEHVAGNMRADDWRYWIPLVCLFTGARIGEIAQLRVGNIEESFGVPVIHIREDEKAGQRTKSRRSRFVPIHSRLARLGFLDFVARQRAAAADRATDRLFSELQPNSRDQISGTPSRFFRDYLKRIGVKQGADGLGQHAFRHTLADQLRAAGKLDPEIGVVLGHASTGVTAGYGVLQQGTVHWVHDMLESAQFDGVRLDHLMR